MSTESITPGIIFPKPLPPFNSRIEPDETGFTALEKTALKNAWRVIKLRLRRHARGIFLKFFTKHELLLEKFRFNNGKLCMESLHQHPVSSLRAFGRLIESGLQDMPTTSVVVSDIATHHRKFGVAVYQTEFMTTAIKEHFEEVLAKISSPTLIQALNKMRDLINLYHNQELKLANEKEKKKEKLNTSETDEELDK